MDAGGGVYRQDAANVDLGAWRGLVGGLEFSTADGVGVASGIAVEILRALARWSPGPGSSTSFLPSSQSRSFPSISGNCPRDPTYLPTFLHLTFHG